MLSPLSITGPSQGKLTAPPKDETEYWNRHAEDPQIEDLAFWHAVKIEWPRWSLRYRADRC